MVLIYGNNSPNVARNYCNILILVVTDSYHNDHNLCGEKQIATIQPVRGKRSIATKTNFVVSRGYHNKQHVCGANLLQCYKYSWRKDYCNKAIFGGARWLSQRPKYLWRETIATIQIIATEKNIGIQLYYSNHYYDVDS
jgi:hypothetical protein